MPFDWNRFHLDQMQAPAAVDPQRRLRICRAVFLGVLGLVLARAVQIEVTQGAAFRREALRPLVRQKSLPGVRGRILARDGTVLACDKKILSLAVHYRYLQQPPDRRWLRRMALGQLSRAERRDHRRVDEEQARVQAECAQTASRLVQLTGISAAQWNARAERIQTRVERIAAGVNRRRQTELRTEARGDVPADGLLDQLKQTLVDALRGSVEEVPVRIIVAEERDYHVVAEGLPLAVVAEIQAHPRQYPGVKIVEQTRRDYPSGTLAAHVLGHLGHRTTDGGAATADKALHDEDAGRRAEDLVGCMGVERQYESLLCARQGTLVELTDHGGRTLSSERRQEPGVGRDLVLTLDPQLQQTAETLLDSALERRLVNTQTPQPAGGAVVVLDVHTGAMLAAASAPRFDPNQFVGGKPAEVAALLSDQAHPLVDRVGRMALPPGSVFKTLSAVALLEDGRVDPQAPLDCRGFLRHPDQQRCAIYVRHGIGHGEVTLARALAVSCNVYFFHHCQRLDPAVLVAWAERFGFGDPTAVDLPGEAAGTLPTPATIHRWEGRPWRSADTQMLAIGQSALTATPLQVACMMAAMANGGQRVRPHVVSRLALPDDTLAGGAQLGVALGEAGDSEPQVGFVPPRLIPGLRPATFAAIRDGLERVVADADGTGHGTVHLEGLAIAGKTGTAQAGAGRADHAWFAGYVPADKPRWALVVVLEHSGDGATAAGPLVRRLVLRMQQLRLL